MLRFALAALVAAALLVPVATAHDGHVHQAHDVAADAAPKITGFRIEKAPAGGWTVLLDTANFSFVPDTAADAETNLGHALLYINGTALAALYAPIHHLDELPFGPHDFRVVLNTRAQEEYAVAGRAIDARLTLTVE
ncbi:MAG TPA: hypothetical protein PK286_01050 [Devosia sp.]|nr:hypothetical protein [Devosia sp.]